MVATKLVAGVGMGAITIAAGLAVPALGAPDGRREVQSTRRVLPTVGGFTPSAADPKLAALLARNGIDPSDFRFTPAESGRASNRAVTVAVRARSNRGMVERTGVPASAAAAVSAPALAPIAYNLGVSVGWKRFAVAGDLARLDLAGQPGSSERMGVGVSYAGKRASGRVSATSQRPIGTAPTLVADAPSTSVDFGGAYKLTRNLDVTAGVRYTSEKDRLLRLDDDRRDSQAVYVGTAFRF